MPRSILLSLALAFWAPSLSALQITQSSSPILYVDTGNSPVPLMASYASYLVSNTGTVTVNDVWVAIGGFSSANVGKAAYETGLHQLGAIAPGETKAVYFYLQGTPTASATGYSIYAYTGHPPAATLVTSAGMSFSSVSNITINSGNNVVNTVLSGPNPGSLGGVITMQVSGTTGTLGGSGVMSFTPASYADWPADAFELFSVTIQLLGPGNFGSTDDHLLLIAGATGTTDYLATYRFKAVHSTTQPTTVSPIAFLSSGAQIKHTDTGGFASANFAALQSLTNYLSLQKTASTGNIIWPNPASYSIGLDNAGGTDASIDTVVDLVPTSPGTASYVTGTSAYDGVPIPDPVLLGGTLVWNGPFAVAQTSRSYLTYQLSFPHLTGTFYNGAYAWVGSTRVDSTLDITDNSPSSAAVIQGFPTATPTRTVSPTSSATPTLTPPFTATHTPSISPSFSESPTFSESPSITVSPTHTITADGSFTETPSSSTSPTRTSTATLSPSSTKSPSPTFSATATPTPSASSTATVTLTRTVSLTRTFSPTRTSTLTYSVSPTLSASATATPSPPVSGTATPTISRTSTVTRSVTFSPSQTLSFTESPTFSVSPSFSSTASSTPSASATPTASPSSTETPSFSASPTFSVSPTITVSFTGSPSFSATPSLTATLTPISMPAAALPRPNPFWPTRGQTLYVDVDVATPGTVRVKAFNLAGELVCSIADTDFGNGRHTVAWNGRNAAGDPVAAGVYFVLVEAPGGLQKRFLVGILK
jgi:hypothetical protein